MKPLDAGSESAIHAVRARHDHGIRATQRLRRLAQPPERKQVPVDRGPARVDQHEIEITRHLAMLEAVIQHQRVHPALHATQSLDRATTVRADGDGRLGHLRAVLEHLVRRLPAAMTTHHDGRRAACSPKFRADPAHDR